MRGKQVKFIEDEKDRLRQVAACLLFRKVGCQKMFFVVQSRVSEDVFCLAK